jgi:hypothetical protein
MSGIQLASNDVEWINRDNIIPPALFEQIKDYLMNDASMIEEIIKKNGSVTLYGKDVLRIPQSVVLGSSYEGYNLVFNCAKRCYGLSKTLSIPFEMTKNEVDGVESITISLKDLSTTN